MGLLDYLYVPHCPSCDRRLHAPLPFCEACAISLYDLGPACPRCAEPISGPVAVECSRCRRAPPPYTSVVAPFRYGGELAVALRKLKYERRPDIARTLAPLLRSSYAQAARPADLAVPIPLHWRRFAARGFNQSERLLQYASKGSGAPIDRLSLRRCRATAVQSGLDARRRAANVAGAFAVKGRRGRQVSGRRVLLVDDIMTTGATLAAATRALLEAGASEVSCFCVARAEVGGP